MDFEKAFPLRYWINLGSRSDRRVETEIALAQAGITAERFPAVNARFVRRWNGYESAGRYALALTQRLALRAAALRKAEAVMIFEDDVVFHPELRARLAEIELPDDWGIFYLGCAHQKRPWRAGHGLVRTPYALDTHAFAVRAPYYRRVMEALRVRKGQDVTHARASDWFLADLHREIPTYACYPNLAWQAVAQSDLTGGRYSNYTASGEQVSAAGEIIGLQGEMWGVGRWPQGAGLTVEPKRSSPKMGLLFLTRGRVHQEEIWREFVEDAGGEVRVFSHVKQRELGQEGFLAGTGIEDWHETKWGDISLVRAMMSLLKAAMRDGQLTHFAFVSESCIPVRPWLEMKRRLAFDSRSILVSKNTDSMREKHRERIAEVRDLPARCQRTHSQWMILNREAAECVTEVDFTTRFAKLEAADEHYVGSMLAVRGFDERKICQQDATWVKWREGSDGIRPESFGVTDSRLAAELASFGGFFARKFEPGSDVGKWGLHRGVPSESLSGSPRSELLP